MNRSLRYGCYLCGLMLLAGCHRPSPVVVPTIPPIPVALPVERDVVEQEEFIGRTDAVSRVDIRARVSGYLVKVNFKDGEIVKKDQLLYQIDPRPFQAALDAAKGVLERLEAEKKLLVIQVDRYQKLAEKGAGSQQDLDQYVAQQAENLGSINASKAQVEQAQLNLDFTKIEAPIAGKMSRTLLTEGNLVAADNTLLTTLMSINPIYAYFDVDEPTLLRVQNLKREGKLGQRMGMVQVHMGLADDLLHKYPLTGLLDFANNTVDPQTGTITVRGVFENPFEMPNKPPVLMPGLFVRVRLEVGVPHKTCLITERAIGTDQGQKYVYVVGPDNKVVYRPVTLGQMFDGLQSIDEGLKPDDRVVVDGLQRIRPKMEVKPEEVKMEDLASPH